MSKCGFLTEAHLTPKRTLSDWSRCRLVRAVVPGYGPTPARILVKTLEATTLPSPHLDPIRTE
ncbi:hypothetical protein PHLCEN_2v12763 [Hermanssonia centrifuga]|uniref:Uncharacterized protein n=1 Tax=Hermanssonia centrifuga TaxID=98765 RepID=A0A2R6NG96_9APHY|nr:hypothetical protein PHLCEN_2v12763 [Hermanssonia centrifuga]